MSQVLSSTKEIVRNVFVQYGCICKLFHTVCCFSFFLYNVGTYYRFLLNPLLCYTRQKIFFVVTVTVNSSRFGTGSQDFCSNIYHKNILLKFAYFLKCY